MSEAENNYLCLVVREQERCMALILDRNRCAVSQWALATNGWSRVLCRAKGNATSFGKLLEIKAALRERRPHAESTAPLIYAERFPVTQNSSFAYVTTRNAAAVIGASDARISRISPEGRVFVPLPLNHTCPSPHQQTKAPGHLSVSGIH